MKGVRSGVERRRGRVLKPRCGRRDAPAKVLKDRRPPRERGRMGTSVFSSSRASCSYLVHGPLERCETARVHRARAARRPLVRARERARIVRARDVVEPEPHGVVRLTAPVDREHEHAAGPRARGDPAASTDGERVQRSLDRVPALHRRTEEELRGGGGGRRRRGGGETVVASSFASRKTSRRGSDTRATPRRTSSHLKRRATPARARDAGGHGAGSRQRAVRGSHRALGSRARLADALERRRRRRVAVAVRIATIRRAVRGETASHTTQFAM